METLGFVKSVTDDQFTVSGMLYQHSWPTGNQALIFTTHEEAEKWAERSIGKPKYYGPA